MSKQHPDDDNENSGRPNEPFYHESENFVSAYFGKVPEHLLSQESRKNPKELMSNILSLLTDPRNRELRTELLSLLRNNDARELLVTMIGMKEYRRYRRDLLVAAWESGLDFTPHLPFFADLLVEKELEPETLLEILTVIEEMQGPFPPDIVEKVANQIAHLPENHAFYPLISAVHRKLTGNE